ncbi:MAG: hypothetical protein KC483_00955 [Nitrosarchaeum sp.]|nr:hypothetical protein [Nitrosarchaeum sp.]MCA9820850.1 hypothetical protein [Nitrosarchaeum sp.]
MTNFESFYDELTNISDRHVKNNVSLKIEKDPQNDIIKIYGEKSTALSRAQNGLSDVLEIAFTTAEHHPFWRLLSSCAEISNTLLENWNGTLTKDDLNEIDWYLKELTQGFQNLKNNSESRQR